MIRFMEHLNAYKDGIIEDFKRPEFASSIPGQYLEHFKKIGKQANTSFFNSLNYKSRFSSRPWQAPINQTNQ